MGLGAHGKGEGESEDLLLPAKRASASCACGPWDSWRRGGDEAELGWLALGSVLRMVLAGLRALCLGGVLDGADGVGWDCGR